MKKMILLAIMISMFMVACEKVPSEKTRAKAASITAETSKKVTGGNRGIFQKGRMY